MAIIQVRTPEPGVNDTVGAVTFIDGVARVDEDLHAAELRYFRSAGYLVDEPAGELVDEPADVDGDGVVDELPKRSASTEVWRAFAVEHGMPEEEANSKSRDELVALYTKEAGQ